MNKNIKSYYELTLVGKYERYLKAFNILENNHNSNVSDSVCKEYDNCCDNELNEENVKDFRSEILKENKYRGYSCVNPLVEITTLLN